MALSADSTPHFTTIAGFVARLDREIVGVYREARASAMPFSPSVQSRLPNFKALAIRNRRR